MWLWVGGGSSEILIKMLLLGLAGLRISSWYHSLIKLNWFSCSLWYGDRLGLHISEKGYDMDTAFTLITAHAPTKAHPS